MDDRIVETNRLELEYVKSTVTGGVDVRRFGIDNDMKRLLYVSREVDASQIRNIVEYISRFRDKITCTEVSQGKHPFYALHRPRDPAIFEKSGKLVGVITGAIESLSPSMLLGSTQLMVSMCSPAMEDSCRTRLLVVCSTQPCSRICTVCFPQRRVAQWLRSSQFLSRSCQLQRRVRKE